MNIIEAIKSGKKYRQKGEVGWYHPPADYRHYNFSIEQVLGDDWEVEPTAVTINREQFDQAWVNCIVRNKICEFSRDELAKELGL